MHDSETRVCRACGQPFVISAEEFAWWARFSEHTGRPWHLPTACAPCRAARRQARLTVVDDGCEESLTCVVCGAGFRFGTQDKAYYAARGFQRPRRCRACRGLSQRPGATHLGPRSDTQS